MNGDTVSSIVSSLNNRNPKPFAVSFNEICWTQWLQLWNQYFGVNGYVAEAQWAAIAPSFHGRPASDVGQNIPGSNPVRRYSRLTSNCSAFGNVTAILGTSATRQVRYFNDQNASNINNDKNENKGAVCVQTNVFNAVSCSIHTSAAAAAATKNQSFEFSVFVNQWTNAGVGMFVMGDYNLWPTDDPYFNTWWYAVFAEADEKSGRPRANKGETTDGGSPIDYIFRRSPNAYSVQPYIYQSSFSDHHWYEAYL
ncbi:MAG: endonuclease/exonuclease/phosphatase family protein [Actinobacteria bacterium]|nr:endonuclease/exonuclease/phosphatase family protein [Actinomycetota bacterium]